MSKFQAYKIRDARANFSYLVKSVGKSNKAYVVQDRNTPKAVLIDYDTAVAYLPGEYLIECRPKKSFYEAALELTKGQKPNKNDKDKYLSRDIDKILYGQ